MVSQSEHWIESGDLSYKFGAHINQLCDLEQVTYLLGASVPVLHKMKSRSKLFLRPLPAQAHNCRYIVVARYIAGIQEMLIQ